MPRDFTPRPYGELITNHILDNQRCNVWAGMGTGKTVSTLNAIDQLFIVEDSPVLVVAPLRVARDTWKDEAAKWNHLSHLRVSPIVGNEKQRREALRARGDIYTTNFENLPWLVETMGDRWNFQTVIVDEASKLSGFRLRQGTKRAKAFASVAHTKIKRYVNLTGTPSARGLTALWGQNWFVDRGARLGKSFEAFKSRWFRTSFDGYGLLPNEYAQEQIQKALADITIAIDARDWFDLHEPVVTNLYVDLPAKAAQLYRDMERKMFMELAGHEVEAFNAAAKTQKCLQIANGAAYVGEGAKDWEEIHDAKFDVLESIIEEACGMPVLCAYNFKSDAARLLKRFKGSVNLSTAEGLAKFKRGESPLGIAHPASMGHGIDGLQDVTNILAFFAMDWNLENRLQFIERIGATRQAQSGHDRPTFIYNILAKDTVDELVLERVTTKKEVEQILLDAMKRKGFK